MTELENDDDRRLTPQFTKGVWFVLFAISVAIMAWYVLAQLTDLMVTVAISFFLALALEPVVNRLARRGWKRGAATGVVFGGGFVLIVTFFTVFGGLLANQLVGLFRSAPTLYAEFREFFADLTSIRLPQPGELIEQYWQSAAQYIASQGIGILTESLTIVFGTLTVLLVSFYLIADGPKFRRTVCQYLPPKRQRTVLAVWEVAIDKTSSYILSRLTLAVVCGTATTLFLLIIGVDYALALGSFTGIVAAFIPTIGTYIAGAVPVLVAFTQSTWQGVATLIFILAYQQVENLTIEPKISAKAMEMNTAVAFLSVLAGAAILGPVGAFLSLPFAATVKAFVSTYLRRNEVVESELTALK